MKRDNVRLIFSSLAIFAITAVAMRFENRLWVPAAGSLRLWVSDAWGSETSQHLFDPYSVTHVLHGVVLMWLIVPLLPRLGTRGQFLLMLASEAAWEIFENSAFVVERYRAATAAHGYTGDTVVNALGDLACCAVGFELARRMGWRRSIGLFIATEILLMFWIRDSLLLNILMLAWPIEAIEQWQLGN